MKKFLKILTGNLFFLGEKLHFILTHTFVYKIQWIKMHGETVKQKILLLQQLVVVLIKTVLII